MDKFSSLLFSKHECEWLEEQYKQEKIIEEFTDTCKSCGSSSFEIKSEHGVTYQHCAYCGRDTVIKQKSENKSYQCISSLPEGGIFKTIYYI